MANQHIYITGGASGIGEATVKLFASRGWRVTFSDLNIEGGNALAAAIGDSALFIPADTRNRDEILGAVDGGIAKFGPLSSVFCNAGIHRSNTMLDISDDELDLLIDINIRGTVNTLKVAVPKIIEAGGGTVVINASDQSKIGKYHSFGYGLTKGALGQITKSMALDLAANQVRVNAVCPATIYTPLVSNIFSRLSQVSGKAIEDYEVEEKAEHPIGRMGRPEEVAECVWFLATPASSFVTGTLLSVDGGLTCR